MFETNFLTGGRPDILHGLPEASTFRKGPLAGAAARRSLANGLLASALVELGKLDQAIEEFEAAIELNPDHLPQRFALADALVQARQSAKAKKVLEDLLRRDPKFPGADTLLESLNKKP